MVIDGCTLHILAAGFSRECGEEGGHGLDFWEVAVDLAIFEEIVEHH
jgi:hypothetical protein